VVDVFQHLEKVAFRRGFNGALDVVAPRDEPREPPDDAEIEADPEAEA